MAILDSLLYKHPENLYVVPTTPTPDPNETKKDFVMRAFQDSVTENFLYRPVTATIGEETQNLTLSSLTHAVSKVGGYVKNIKTEQSCFNDRVTISANCSVPFMDETTASTLGSFPGLRNMTVTTDPVITTDSIYLYPDSNYTLGTASDTFTVAMDFDTTAGSVNLDFQNIYHDYRDQQTREDRIKQVVKAAIKGNLRIEVRDRSKIGRGIATPQEEKARQTLRDIISEKEWRRYITNGFVMVRGKSGKFYQIFVDRSHTIVWENNKRAKELCIVAADNCPPTDHVITIKTMIELDEDSVWSGANAHLPRSNWTSQYMTPENENLVKKIARVA